MQMIHNPKNRILIMAGKHSGKFLRIGLTASGPNPSSAKFSLRVAQQTVTKLDARDVNQNRLSSPPQITKVKMPERVR